MGAKKGRFPQRFARVFASGVGKIEARVNQSLVAIIRQCQHS